MKVVFYERDAENPPNRVELAEVDEPDKSPLPFVEGDEINFKDHGEYQVIRQFLRHQVAGGMIFTKRWVQVAPR